MHSTRLFIASLMLFAGSAALHADTIIDTNAVWRFRAGQTEASSPDMTSWRTLSFDDIAAGFTNAPAPFWYGDPYTGGTLLSTMLNNHTCIFLRKTFVITNLSQISTLRFGAIVDDGFVVWINGVEVTRLNVTDANPTIGTLAANATEPVPFVEYALPAPSGYLVQGTNIIAVQGFNTTLNSSDFGLNLSLRSILTETNPPTIVSAAPTPGSSPTNLTQITVTFSENVDGVTADDLIVNGIGASGVSGSGATYTFTFPQPPYGAVPISFGTNSGIVDLSVPPNAFNANAPGASWLYTLRDVIPPTVASIFPQPGASVRSLGQVEIIFSEDVGGVNASDLLINNQPATNVIAQVGGRYTFQFAPPPDGSVSVAWANANGIADLATPPNAFPTSAGWSYQFNPSATVGDLVINEILVSAVNTNGLREPSVTPEDPDPLPWIEIYNRGTNSIDLANWALSDDSDFPGQWVFPSRLLPAGQYLIVFASGLDIKNPTGTNRFHTNFKLSRGGEFVGLYSPDSPRTLVSGFTFPEQRNDISFGYDTNRQLRYFSTPTPGTPNGSSSIIGVVEPVHFSVSRGHFAQPFDLVLTCPTPGAAIVYTTNGSEPSLLNGFRYANTLRVTNTTLMRAAAFRTNLLSSRIGTHTYFFNVAANLRSLPVFSIVTAVGNLTGPNGIYGISNVTQNADGTWAPAANGYFNVVRHGFAWEKPTSVEFIRPEDNSGFQVDAGIRLQGSDYQRPRIQVNDKMSFRLYFRSDYGSGRLNYPLFPLTQTEGFDQIVLRAGFNELNNPFIRDELVRRISHDMGGIAAHGTLSVVAINGNFFTSSRNAGNSPWFNPTERVHEEFMQNYLGGGGEWDVVGPSFAQSAGAPGVIDGDRADFTSLVSYTRNNPTTNQAVYQTIARRLDLVNFADYCLLNAYVNMGDWPQNNWRAGRERNNTNALWRFIVWDAEWGMGIYARTAASNMFTAFGAGPEGGGLSSTNDSEIAQMYQRLVLNPEFRLLWADRIQKHFFNGGALTVANYTNRLAQMRVQLQPFFNMTDAKLINWPTDRLPVIMPQFNNHGLFGYSNATHGLFASSNAPAFNQHGGRVAPGFSLSMSTPIAGSPIYFTTNGADPRVMFSGAISNAAIAYTGPITLGQSALIRARALLNGTNWSAINEATFEVARAGIPLRITEIHYNPADSPAHEFIELQNIGGAAVDLSGMHFDGINYTFLLGTSLAPGARLVLASDTDPRAFTNRYPGVPVFGNFGGSLNNGGERIAVLDRFGNIITSVDYRDSGGWAVAADGAGPSLEVSDAAGDPDDPANWRASSAAGGTPGAGSPVPALGNVRLNEVGAENLSAVSNGATFPDWIELVNAGAAAVNIAGWSLTDDGNARKFVFPTGTSIPAGGYLVVWCDAATNTTQGLHTGFSLDRTGDNLFLYDAGSNRVDAVGFGYQLADLSLGRVGGEWKLNQPTPNAVNVAAATSSETVLLINEWLANPPAGSPDWVELFNNSALPVGLRGLYVGTSNAIQQITALSFVPAGGFVQLFCDEDVGWNHLDFRLPATTGAITLASALGVEFERVTYGAQTEGATRGRFPNGSSTFTNFVGSTSPGASNYFNTYSGAIISEVLARNQSITNGGRVADFIELFNPGASAFNLSGMSLSVDALELGQWSFPPNTSIAPNSYLVIWCDGSRPVSTNAGDFNTGRSLDGESGGVYLFAPSGQLVNSVVYGFQIADKSIAMIDGTWQLAAAVTAGAANSAAAALGSISAVRINEWMANPASGPDWFELFNSGGAPVNLEGLLLTDDPSVVGTTNATRLGPLSFIDARGFVKCIADGQPDQGRNHVNFSLDAAGEIVRLYQPNGTAPIDSVAFGVQLVGVSAGRLPDGVNTFATFAGSPTPGESNYQLVTGVVISEVLARSASPLEDAIEIQNRNSSSVAIGGWYLSDDQRNFKKFRIADGANIGANAFTVFYEAQFNSGSNRFTLDGAGGGEVWLSAADPAGNLTGQRASAKFGAAPGGVSIGRIETSTDVDYSALNARTFGADAPTTLTQFRTGLGASNAMPRVGPVVISEIMYHPAATPADEEFIELLNTTASPVALFDSTNTWHLSDAVSFRFPPNTTLAANGSLLIVGFDPANTALLNAFRTRHSLAASVPVFGPWTGSLGNDSDDIELLRPDTAEGGFVPYVRMARVNYADTPPWPSGAVDGGGLSLQRRTGNVYGNEARSWLADVPTPGRANGGGIVPPPVITQSPSNRLALEGSAFALNVAAAGAAPLSYQWRFNGFAVPDATNASLPFDFASLESAGQYDVIVINPGGTAVSDSARLTVAVPPEFTLSPISVAATPTNRVQFVVMVRGSEPITYQWHLNGVPLPGETGTTLIRDSIQLPDDGVYSVTASNAFGTATASASLSVLVRPVFTVQPLSQSVVAGGDLTLSVSAAGNPLPFTWRFLRNGAGVGTNVLNSRDYFFTVTNLPVGTVTYRVAVTNLAGSAASGNATITVLADTDGDGIPDDSETAFGLDPNNRNDRDGDADNDGVSNVQEYRAGTDPKDGASFLKIDNLSRTGETTLRFGSSSNKTYTVQYTDRLGSGGWQRLANVLAQPSNSVQVISDPVAATNRFYRVVTPWQP